MKTVGYAVRLCVCNEAGVVVRRFTLHADGEELVLPTSAGAEKVRSAINVALAEGDRLMYATRVEERHEIPA